MEDRRVCPDGGRCHHGDAGAIMGLLSDPEIVEMRAEMEALALLPLKRSFRETRPDGVTVNRIPGERPRRT